MPKNISKIEVELKVKNYKKATRQIDKLTKRINELGTAAQRAQRAFEDLKSLMPIELLLESEDEQ